MDIWTIVLTVLGLAVFETVSSIDNAVVNAEVLSTMQEKSRRWFLRWGLLFAVFGVRGVLPWLIMWGTAPSLGAWGSLMATFSGDESVHKVIESATPSLLIAGGTFLILLFLHWLFMEPKTYGLRHEKFFHEKSVWFYGAASVLLLVLTWIARDVSPNVQFGAVVGSTAFFITHGFKQSAEKEEEALTSGKASGRSDLSKLMYLEVIDTVFSVDGVLGAFAFTVSVPLIILGNGLGSLIVRQMTIGNIERIARYKFLKNGAMYSICALGIIMVVDSLGGHIPEWLSPIITFAVVGYFVFRSLQEERTIEAIPVTNLAH